MGMSHKGTAALKACGPWAQSGNSGVTMHAFNQQTSAVHLLWARATPSAGVGKAAVRTCMGSWQLGETDAQQTDRRAKRLSVQEGEGAAVME